MASSNRAPRSAPGSSLDCQLSLRRAGVNLERQLKLYAGFIERENWWFGEQICSGKQRSSTFKTKCRAADNLIEATGSIKRKLASLVERMQSTIEKQARRPTVCDWTDSFCLMT